MHSRTRSEFNRVLDILLNSRFTVQHFNIKGEIMLHCSFSMFLLATKSTYTTKETKLSNAQFTGNTVSRLQNEICNAPFTGNAVWRSRNENLKMKAQEKIIVIIDATFSILY